MADRTNTDPARMEKIVSLCKRRGFIFQSAEIYGGLNGCWDYLGWNVQSPSTADISIEWMKGWSFPTGGSFL